MLIFENFSMFILSWAFFIHHKLFWFGLLSGAFLISFDAEDDSKKKIIFAVLGVISAMPLAAYLAIPRLADAAGTDISPVFLFLQIWFGCVVLSWVVAVLWLRFGVQKFEKIAKSMTKTAVLERNKMTDIREIHKFLPSDKQRFDPLKYISPKQGVFVGLSESDQPIFIKKGDWETSHIMLGGRTRSGKGVAAQSLGIQSIQRGELFVVLDPKCDNWMPHIYKKACEKAGKEYVFLDLRQSAHEQINMFQGCDYETAENMLLAGFSLAPRGDNADAYRTQDRKAARQAARYVADHPGVTPREVLNILGAGWREGDGESKLTAGVFADMMSEMGELASVNRKSGGIDLEKLVETGGCLYVVGDMMNSRIIMMQRMILIRLLMMAKNREQTDDMKIIRVFADEFRVHISRPFIVSLGASAGYKLLSILAFQSFEDLRDCPGDLDGDMVKGAVLENSAIQLSYRIKDAETAEILAAATGKILVDVESREVEKNMALVETIEGERRISQSERYLIDVNMITSLPVPDTEKKTIGCGVLVGASPTAQFCFTSPVMVERTKDAITPTVLPPEKADEVQTTEDKLENLESLEPKTEPVRTPPRPGMILDEKTGRWNEPPRKQAAPIAAFACPPPQTTAKPD